MKNQGFAKRLSFALQGIKAGLSEASFRTQLIFTLLATIALLIFQPTLIWWALIFLTCSLVLAAELMNTALEALCDHVSPEFQPAIKLAKDTAAGAVLVLSFGSLLVASLMLLSVYA